MFTLKCFIQMFCPTDPDHSLLTVVTWSAPHAEPIIPADEAPSILLSSLSEYIHLRRVQMTPLLQISLPRHMSYNNAASLNGSWERSPSPGQQGSLISRFRRFIEQRAGKSPKSGSTDLMSDTIRKSSSILHYRSPSTGVMSRSGLVSDQSQVIREENELDCDTADSDQLLGPGLDQGTGDGVDGMGDVSGQLKMKPLQRAVSEGGLRHSPSPEVDIAATLSETAGWSQNLFSLLKSKHGA